MDKKTVNDMQTEYILYIDINTRTHTHTHIYIYYTHIQRVTRIRAL